MKEWRDIAIRYEKRARDYLAVVIVASLIVWFSRFARQVLETNPVRRQLEEALLRCFAPL